MERRKKETVAVGLAASTLALLGAGMASEQRRTAGGDLAMVPPTPDVEPEVDPFADIIPQEWDLPSDRNERVDFFIDFLKGERFEDMKEWLERIGKYGPMIREELSARDMPQDLLFLAIIESGLDPNAYSPADAAGIWQFIEPTGERYGLEVSEYVDERRDPVKATAAALTYLEELHDRFDSWFLAAASYNTGENRVGRIMEEVTGSERGSDENYWDISDRLPRETRDYVPLMIAAGHIAKDPGAHGFPELEFQDPLRFDVVSVPAGTPLSEVAEAAGASEEEVRDLNPHLVRGQTPPDREWDVRIPEGARTTFAANFGVETGPGSTEVTE
ncbi:MAG: transglycosylase SLT domain-containing protein [Gemmatimonadetes bacterium]|nr:lytic transglycosylase domain-containing protein [Gemmatimonadota bacterium]NIQ52822.1 lytic transglycosylase domain-containing protein [Gemmatimonadota bacterium]NIU72952.1 transglycosylase SLT domain-containing protein [Gammaproteobacteria bacterium]NIX43307.1 transglycosylase SLT domain-containing protein [Gemmatimonadota bacterium]NIY07477.1 transglycosylase SLT domain-containing protein [Gemmatimonadota bacterium]